MPSDQHLSKIETLIDELSSKLRAIEEQNALDDATVDITDPDESVPSEAQSNSLKKVGDFEILKKVPRQVYENPTSL